MVITILAIATILVGKPNQLQPPSQPTQQEVVATQEQQISQPSTESYITEYDVVNSLNIQTDTTEEITPNEEENNDNCVYFDIEWDGKEAPNQDDEIPKLGRIEQYMVD